MEAEKPQKQRHPRRSFTDEFKAEVVRQVLVGHKTAGQLALQDDAQRSPTVLAGLAPVEPERGEPQQQRLDRRLRRRPV